ncbi:unnamed protein product [Parnassius apollo]|uniref:(apollo) hypothetical protein n=1 Tax=Parnassius apollo TaxID=110799 RepID=A0A8S3W5D3_PARAO|nr:unnamed protein product [Parnassius apollo]
MARKIVAIEDIEEYLHMEDSSCLELEDIEEFSEHDTDSEQNGEDFELPADNAIIDQTSSAETIPRKHPDEYILCSGYYLVKDGATKWKVSAVSQHCSGNTWAKG